MHRCVVLVMLHCCHSTFGQPEWVHGWGILLRPLGSPLALHSAGDRNWLGQRYGNPLLMGHKSPSINNGSMLGCSTMHPVRKGLWWSCFGGRVADGCLYAWGANGTQLKSCTPPKTWNAETFGWILEVCSMFNVPWHCFINLLHNVGKLLSHVNWPAIKWFWNVWIALSTALTGFSVWSHICNHSNYKPPCVLAISCENTN